MMKQRKLQIDELRLRVSGINRSQARQLGEMVAQQLSNAQISEAGPRDIPALSVRVVSKSTNSIGLLAANIADSIRRKL